MNTITVELTDKHIDSIMELIDTAGYDDLHFTLADAWEAAVTKAGLNPTDVLNEREPAITKYRKLFRPA